MATEVDIEMESDSDTEMATEPTYIEMAKTFLEKLDDYTRRLWSFGLPQARASNMENDKIIRPPPAPAPSPYVSDIEMATNIVENLDNELSRLQPKDISTENLMAHCIYRVPQPLRDVNSKAYTPQLISIGPFHRGHKILAMGRDKLRYFEKLTERNGMDKKKRCDIVISIKNQEKHLRSCYSEKFYEIKSNDFVKMILLDAVFIIEFFLESNAEKGHKRFKPRMTFDIREDLMLLENQLPLSIIEKIYDQVSYHSSDNKHKSFLDLATCYLKEYLHLQVVETSPNVEKETSPDVGKEFNSDVSYSDDSGKGFNSDHSGKGFNSDDSYSDDSGKGFNSDHSGKGFNSDHSYSDDSGKGFNSDVSGKGFNSDVETEFSSDVETETSPDVGKETSPDVGKGFNSTETSPDVGKETSPDVETETSPDVGKGYNSDVEKETSLGVEGSRHFTDLLRNLMLCKTSQGVKKETSPDVKKETSAGVKKEPRHLTDLLRSLMLSRAIQRTYSSDPVKLNYSAIMLHKAGVRFQVTRDKCFVNITFDRGVLKIPQLEVDHNFERLVLNIMAMEQCLYEGEAYICSYIKFMDHLIDSAEDVGLLVEKGIIVHRLGNDAAVSNMINDLCKNIGDNDTCFGNIFQELNVHYENRGNHRKATLKLVYFPNIWRGTGTVAAAMLLILTLIQTIRAFF